MAGGCVLTFGFALLACRVPLGPSELGFPLFCQVAPDIRSAIAAQAHLTKVPVCHSSLQK